MKIGYARVSTRGQETEHQVAELAALGIPPQHIHIDHGYSGKNTDRPALRTALACLRPGDVLVVTKLDRLARSVIDAHAIAEQVTAAGAGLRYGQSTYLPDDPSGRLFFTMLAAFAEFERGLISLRTRDGLATAKRHGRLGGRPPKLSADREKLLVKLVTSDQHTQREAATLFGVSHSTVQRALRRAGA